MLGRVGGIRSTHSVCDGLANGANIIEDVMTRVLVFAHALIFEKFSGIMASSSCEHSRSSPYSEDIRWRIIWQKLALDHKCPEIAQNLNIDSYLYCQKDPTKV